MSSKELKIFTGTTIAEVSVVVMGTHNVRLVISAYLLRESFNKPPFIIEEIK